MALIPHLKLTAFIQEILQAGGFSNEDARQTTELLVWANLRGIESHGVLRVPRYLEMLSLGIMTSGNEIKTVREIGAIRVIDGDKCPGSVGMSAAAHYAIKLAAKNGIGVCSARNISHAGAIGYFTTKIAQKGFIGIAMTASKPLMAYFGAKGEAVSTNPISISTPTRNNGAPITLDMSTAAVALGKIMSAKDSGTMIPTGWGIDENGQDTTKPENVAALLPMAGPKGSGLSLMIEILTSILAGNAVIGPVLANHKKGGFNGLTIAFDPEAFSELSTYFDEIEVLSHQIKNLEKADQNIQIFLPGERGELCAKERMIKGIPVADGTVRNLVATAKKLAVQVPTEFLQ